MPEPPQVAAPEQTPHAGRTPRGIVWLGRMLYILIFGLTIWGVAYTSISRQPLETYWQFLAGLMAAVCIITGWPHASKDARFRLIWSQVLHWIAFLIAMAIVLSPGVRLMLTAPTTGLALLMLLALGTFVAGIHTLSWRICVLGIAMALCVPAVAWLERSALYLFLAVIGLFGLVSAIWWRRAKPAALPKNMAQSDY